MISQMLKLIPKKGRQKKNFIDSFQQSFPFKNIIFIQNFVSIRENEFSYTFILKTPQNEIRFKSILDTNNMIIFLQKCDTIYEHRLINDNLNEIFDKMGYFLQKIYFSSKQIWNFILSKKGIYDDLKIQTEMGTFEYIDEEDENKALLKKLIKNPISSVRIEIQLKKCFKHVEFIPININDEFFSISDSIPNKCYSELFTKFEKLIV